MGFFFLFFLIFLDEITDRCNPKIRKFIEAIRDDEEKVKFFERYSDSDVVIKRLLCLDLPEKQRNIFHHSSEEIKELLNPGFYKTPKINPNDCVLCKKEFKAEIGYLANLSQGNTFAKLVLKEE